MAEPTRTALGSARERFVRGLRERGRELAELFAELERAPADAEIGAQLLRRLHALYASAQVFADRSLLSELGQLIAGFESVRDLGRAPNKDELAPLRDFIARLNEDGGETPQAQSSVPPVTVPPPRVDDEARSSRADDSERSSRADDTERSSRSTVRPAVVLGAFASQPGKVPVAVTDTVTGTFTSPQIIAVLALASPEVGAAVRAALPIDRCELTTTAEPETALSVIDQVAPDVVLVESTLLVKGGPDLVRGLRGARSGTTRSVVALVTESEAEVEALLQRTHADAARRVPTPGDGFLERVLVWSGRGPSRPRGLSALNAGTVDEIARSVAEEVRRGIADSLRAGRSERLELDDKSELMAAAWSAVARIRAHLAEEADGRIRFDDAAQPGGPSVLALTGRAFERTTPAPTPPSLVGRRILIADDDPAVLGVFADLLRGGGAQVLEVDNGLRALEVARRERPDLVVSDILMPALDGFSLCRELKRDPALRHVPVILLSWKEDFLQRMRELDAGASGYLRKEADAAQILATIHEALRPQTELATLLAQGGEVQGRVETIGVPRLLDSVARALPDAHLTLRDAWNLYEIEIREGKHIAVTRTASDGSFVRGPIALRQLLGVEAGRFVVTPASGPLRFALEGTLATSLAEGVAELGALLDAVSDSRLVRVQQIRFDDEILSSLLTATPTALADLVAKLREGTPVAKLLGDGAHAPSELEQQLRELARHGAIVGVRGGEGEDLVAAARAAREAWHAGTDSGDFVRPRRELVMAGLHEPAEQTPAAQAPREPPAPTIPEPAPESAAAQAAPRASERHAAIDAQPAPPASEDRPSRRPPPPSSKAPEAFSVQSALLRAAAQGPRSSPPPAAPRLPTKARARTVAVAASFLAVMAVGFFGWRALKPRGADLATGAARATQVSALQGETEAPGTTPEQPKIQAVTRALPYIDPDRRAALGKDEGLLVVEYSQKGGEAPRVKVGGRDLGRAPVTAALPGGRHEVLLKRGDQTSFRYVVIHPGETRILELSE